MIAHWDEAESGRAEQGHLGGLWTGLGAAAGTRTIGVNRVQVDPGKWSTPFHRQTAEEEIFYVLGGSGICLLEGAPEDHPWTREIAIGPPEIGELAGRPSRIVNVADVDPTVRDGATVGHSVRDLGRAAGSLKTGIRHFEVSPGKLLNPPHCHSAEEEIFAVIAGEGVLELWPHPRFGGEHEVHAVHVGNLVARPAGSGRAHAFRAGGHGLTVLAYGTRDARDVTYYPRSGKVNIRGIGLIGRLDALDYWDGED